MSSSSSSSSLLTPNERHTFMSFLNNVDGVGADDPDWMQMQMYSSHLAPPQGGESALAKATKDLIALHPPAPPRYTATALPAHTHTHTSHRAIAPAPPGKLALAPLPSAGAQKRPSPTEPSPAKRRRAMSPSPAPSTSTAAKPTLLSTQQKKANHIQSEQKRRANIRRGYEALCETVPALREAIRVDEEGSGSGGGGGGGKKKRVKIEEREGEKVDGRAGPRSESVVLQKTIEHIREMLDERSVLLGRLERARSVLGAGHPGLYGHAPLWEREWDGGKGAMGDENDTDDEGSIEN